MEMMKVMVKVMIMMMMIVERGKGRATMLFARGSRLIIPQSNNILTLLKLDSETVVAVDDMLCFILFKQFCTDFFSGGALQLLVGSLYGDTAIDTAAPGSELLVDAACLLGFRLYIKIKTYMS